MSSRHLPIEAFCRVGSGSTPSRAQLDRYYGGHIPWVKSGELREGIIQKTEEQITQAALKETAVKLVPKGAILVAMYGATIGRVGILGVEATTNQAVCHVVPDPLKADTRYLFHALRGCFHDFLAKGVGGAQPNISQQIIRQTPIYLPGISEQRRIASILDQADALRVKRRAALAQLDEMARAIFVEMFGEPGANPKGWPQVRIADLLASATYGTSEKAGAEGEYPILRMNNITYDGKLDLRDLKFIDLKPNEVERYTVRDGDILFNRTNSAELVGKTAVFRHERPMAFAGYLVRLRTNAETCPEYLAAFLNMPHGKAILRTMCKSIIGMANINAKEVQSILIPKPPRALQDVFATKLVGLRAARLRQVSSADALDALFSSLQDRAFRGEL